MGSAASKASKAVPKGAPRKYPTRAAGESLEGAARPVQSAQRPPAADVKAKEADARKSQAPPQPAPEIDGQDADFASRLRQMGIVQPNPTFSPSSIAGRDLSSNDVGGPDADMLRQIQQHQQQYGRPSSKSTRAPPMRNTTLSVLDARRKIQDQATADQEQSMTKAGREKGQEFLRAGTIRDALALRARGVDAAAIEQGLHLKAGVVERLGPRGLFEALNVPEAAPAPETK
ncbi:hypothetical protein F503_06627 [Ophiostoma piceae UAMH 11346]|uniref:Helix-turn-helix domain-containing protein n=1 Tax=Ophiostoma piceae (strain UAMH 11346) TaxID=1262450 RepID=S3BQ36_OPHP1|nr:hypothetical protein F503_06627 [Ophiostoma piceae UAMH 11346]